MNACKRLLLLESRHGCDITGIEPVNTHYKEISTRFRGYKRGLSHYDIDLQGPRLQDRYLCN